MVDYFDSRSPQNVLSPSHGLARPWGRLDYPAVSAHQSGGGAVRLIVFRPGLTAAERRWANLWCALIHREYWVLAAVPLALLSVWALPALPIIWRPVVGGVVAIALLLALWVKTRKTLAAARGVQIRVQPRSAGQGIRGDIALLEEATGRLVALDASQLTPVQYETRWGEIYNWLGTFRVPKSAEAQR